MSEGSVPPAPLRALDWRFLLPYGLEAPLRHLVLLGGGAGLARRAVEVGLARRVSDTLPAPGSADGVVALHGAGISIGDLARALIPGGVLYCEIDRGMRGVVRYSPSSIRREARQANLTGLGFYAVLPDFAEPRIYLPLDLAGPLRWYLSTRASAMTTPQLVLQSALRAVSALDGRLVARLAPRLALTAIAGPGRRPVPAVLDHPELPSDLRGQTLRPVLLTHGGDRVVMLPFAGDGLEPVAVLKVPKLPGFNGRTEHEQSLLRTLGSCLDPATRRSVPRSLGTFRHGEVTVGVETYASAPLLFRSGRAGGARRREHLTDLELTAAWLGDFHAQTEAARPAWGAAEYSRWVEEPLEHYGRTFGLTAAEERLFGETRQYAQGLDGTPLPIVLQHRDFTVWNIGRRGRQLQVLDWEGARPGPALCDLLHFLTHWHETLRHAHDEPARQRCFRRLLFELDRRDRFRQAANDAIGGYLRRVDMSARFLPLLTVYTWVELASRRAEQQRVQEEIGVEPRAGNRYIAMVRILAEHADRLFTGPAATAPAAR